MARHIIKKLFPGMDRLRGHRALAPLGPRLRSPDLWHLNRRSVAGAFAVGLFVAFLPLPMQMLIAGAIAILARVNLPISVILVWISNPVTMPPMLYTAYTVGRKLLGEEPRQFSTEITWEWFATEMLTVWKPLMTGSLVLGVAAGLAGYLLVRGLWRLNVIQRVRHRRYLARQRREREAELREVFSRSPVDPEAPRESRETKAVERQADSQASGTRSGDDDRSRPH
ncbi:MULTISPECIES: DUF2062 domain-containing protein [Thioalkalivibrio]|uniref:DUF2062 domain-containing protein n=1 Tax=Thioalkalivibrio halophilus TaxID=252474 RepID=A0A1V3A236_9GAMM|nr:MULTISPECIES: DUF2062 domain-containing protein [Thioalkalivibrio]OOC11382.1 hypothetical protein B1A74_01015 [Thioalkalivibrio halophilus]PYG04040.1 hypothetical protein D893_00588 [Thioalkalivibrio sp. ALE21]